MGNIRLEVDSLSAAYGETCVLSKLSFDVSEGELLAVMGGSGTGKSTLLNVLCGFMDGCDGVVRIDGTLMTQEGRHLLVGTQRKMGLMFQNFALFPHMTVAENVGFGIRNQSNVSEEVAKLLSWVDLTGFEERSIQSLSGGQKQRVALVRALAPKPALLLLDEPFANLDAEIRRPLGLLLKRLIQEQGTAAVMVTHDHQDALRLADRIAILENGTQEGCVLSQIDTPETLFWAPRSAAAAALTGPSVLFDVEIVDGVMKSPLGDISMSPEAKGLGKMMVRPESLAWRENSEGRFEVRDVYFCGPGYGVEVEAGAAQFSLLNVITPPEVGSRVDIEVTRRPAFFPQGPLNSMSHD